MREVDVFIGLHRDLREAATRIVKMDIVKAREEDYQVTSYRIGSTIVLNFKTRKLT